MSRYVFDGIRRDAQHGKFVVVVGNQNRDTQFADHLKERGVEFTSRAAWNISIGKGRVKFVWNADALRGMSPDVLVVLPEVRDEKVFTYARAIGLGGRCDVVRI